MPLSHQPKKPTMMFHPKSYKESSKNLKNRRIGVSIAFYRH